MPSAHPYSPLHRWIRVNDRITDTLRAAQNLTRITEDEISPQQPDPSGEDKSKEERKVITTAQELQAYDIIKDITQDVVDSERVTIRDAQSYCAILLDNNNRRLLCRLYFDGSQKHIGLFDGSRHSGGTLVEKRSPIESLNGIYTHADQLRETVQRYLES